jgi:hypothetical protein
MGLASLLRIPLGVGHIWGFGRFDWGTRPSPNPMPRVIMIAEKAADMILGRPAPPPAVLPHNDGTAQN